MHATLRVKNTIKGASHASTRDHERLPHVTEVKFHAIGLTFIYIGLKRVCLPKQDFLL